MRWSRRTVPCLLFRVCLRSIGHIAQIRTAILRIANRNRTESKALACANGNLTNANENLANANTGAAVTLTNANANLGFHEWSHCVRVTKNHLIRFACSSMQHSCLIFEIDPSELKVSEIVCSLPSHLSKKHKTFSS